MPYVYEAVAAQGCTWLELPACLGTDDDGLFIRRMGKPISRQRTEAIRGGMIKGAEQPCPQDLRYSFAPYAGVELRSWGVQELLGIIPPPKSIDGTFQHLPRYESAKGPNGGNNAFYPLWADSPMTV